MFRYFALTIALLAGIAESRVVLHKGSWVSCKDCFGKPPFVNPLCKYGCDKWITFPPTSTTPTTTMDITMDTTPDPDPTPDPEPTLENDVKLSSELEGVERLLKDTSIKAMKDEVHRRSENWVRCQDCFGQGIHWKDRDPRCKFGCDKFATSPPNEVPKDTGDLIATPTFEPTIEKYPIAQDFKFEQDVTFKRESSFSSHQMIDPELQTDAQGNGD